MTTRLVVWLLMLVCWPLSGLAIEVTNVAQLEITDQVYWCESAAELELAEVLKGNCAFKPLGMPYQARGYSKNAYWLRVELHNPEHEKIERWLRVGHPRMQQVSLYQMDSNDVWQRTDTGLRVPVASRPVIAANPVLPLMLESGASKSFYLRVASQSTIDLGITLWQPTAYAIEHHNVELRQMLTMGGLIAAMIFSLLIYFKWRERVYLYFSGSLLAEVVLDLSFLGLMPIHFWPTSLSFDIRVLALATGVMMISLMLFIREFVGNMQRYRILDIALQIATGVLVLAVLWACMVHYGEAAWLLYLATLLILLLGTALFYRAWRDGSRPAGYLLASYLLLMLTLVYRVIVALGASTFVDMQSSGQLFRFALITPVILAGIMQRSENLRAEAIQAASRVQFLAQMSHEFRTPLNIMLGYAELLERKSKRITVQEGASSIKRSGRYLLGMIDEILAHARGGAEKLSLSQVCWADFMMLLEQSTAMMMRPRGNRFELTMASSMPVAVMIDERRIRQVLDILLTNANRYTRHGVVKLDCRAIPVNGQRSQILFSVRDTGPGIAPEELELIFQPFVRGRAGKESGIIGTGMGLTIARQLLSLMGGKIEVQNQKQGCCFKVQLECQLAEAHLAAKYEPWLGQLRQHCTVLVVDDEPQSRDLLAMLLLDCGFAVHTAKSGRDARQFLSQSIDLVITDQFMPDGDGWHVLQDWWELHIPVMLLSAAPAQRPQNYSGKYQFAGIQLKPYTADTLLKEMTIMLSLEWESPEPVAQQPKVTRPPQTLLMPLHAMIEEGAVTDIAQWLQIFVEQYPDYCAYGEKIAACNLALDFDSMRRMVIADDRDVAMPP